MKNALSTPAVVIRSARTGDVSAVRQLLGDAELPLDGLEEFFGDAYAVAEIGGTIVGVAGIEVYGTAGLLRSAAIDRSWRGRGIGEALTRDRIAWARRCGLHALYLLTTTASQYFPRLGFQPVERATAPDAIRASREFRDACPESAIFMNLSLGKEEDE